MREATAGSNKAAPGRLWALTENAHTFWEANGRPDWSRYGLTATPDHQWVWFTHPNGARWELPVPPGQSRSAAGSSRR